MTADLLKIYDRLYEYAESRDFSGFDPFDGLNSSLFSSTPLRKLRLARLAWLQTVKRAGRDLRPLLRVKPGVNPKTLALFALAEISRYRTTRDDVHERKVSVLLEKLLALRIDGVTPDNEPTTAFGYNFDWQSRAFYAPTGTPAVVPTAFACQALFEAYEAFNEHRYLDTCEDICRFIVTGLDRVETDDEICFSYTPLDQTRIFNASLLAGECLARVGAATDSKGYLDLAAKTARYVARRQRNDGAWVYGEKGTQAWADNFHTAYVLLSLKRISANVAGLRYEIDDVFKKGLEYWLKNFFLDDGTPKYYDNTVYPVDIHSAAVAISALAEMSDEDERCLPLANKVANWTLGNMLDPAGYFYYQVRQNGVVKTPFMRWGQAWMAYALARLIETMASGG